MARIRITPTDQTAVLLACRRRCAICFGLNRDTTIKQGQIAHLDHDASNSRTENLVFLCLEHHDQYDTKTSQSKGLTVDEVRHFRDELLAAVAEGGRKPVRLGEVDVQLDNVAGQWVREEYVGSVDSARLDIVRLGGHRIKVDGIALHGTDRDDIGPNMGELDYEATISDQTATYEEENVVFHAPYRIKLRFDDERLTVTEEGPEPFGLGVQFSGRYRRAKR